MRWRGGLCWLAVSSLRLFGADPSYYRDVQPILQKNCIGCHQPAMLSSGLDLTTYTKFRLGGKRGPAFEAGSPGSSLVIRFLTGEMKPPMPLGAPSLAKGDIDAVREWIQSGARDDSPAETASNEPTVYRQPPVITALRFSPDGKFLAVGGNREILMHEVTGELALRLPGRADRILSLAFSADGSLLVAGGGTPARFGELQFWDTAAGKLSRSVLVCNDTLFGASISPDGKKVAAGCTDNSVHVFETAGGRELYKMSSHENWVLGTIFGVNSKRFVSVGRDRAAKLVDAEKGQLLENLNELRGELSAVARHPKQDVIVIGGEDRIPYIYTMDRTRNLKVGEESTLVRKLEAQDGAILALDWSPDGKRIAVAGAGPMVNLYDPETGARLAACGGHTADIYSVAFSPDGTLLAAGGFDGQVRIYNVSDCSLRRAMTPVRLAKSAAAAGGRQ